MSEKKKENNNNNNDNENDNEKVLIKDNKVQRKFQSNIIQAPKNRSSNKLIRRTSSQSNMVPVNNDRDVLSQSIDSLGLSPVKGSPIRSQALTYQLNQISNLKKVGKYYLIKTLGEGSFSKVKLGVHELTQEKVAIKIMKKKDLQEKSLVGVVKREIAIMKLIEHPNIVQLKEVLSSPTKLYLVLELITGGELFWHIVSQIRFDEDTARRYFQQLIKGLEYCHMQGVCHRDLKPENLLVDKEGNIKISDFGLSALYIKQGEEYLLKTACGTLQYAAPEVLFPFLRECTEEFEEFDNTLNKTIKRKKPAYNGTAADIWSCGCILYVFLSGDLPFDGEDDVVRLKIQEAAVNFPDYFSEETKNLISRMLTVDSNERITINEIKEDEWFKIGYEDDNDLINKINITDNDVTTSFMPIVESGSSASKIKVTNAFDLINALGTMDMNKMLKRMNSSDFLVKSVTRFSSKATPSAIIEKVTSVLKDMPVSYKVNDFRITVTARGKKSILSFTIELSQIPPNIMLVDFRKKRGEIMDFYNLYTQIEEQCEDIIVKKKNKFSFIHNSNNNIYQ